jgi:uncharacterized protein (TIGR03067 family)
MRSTVALLVIGFLASASDDLSQVQGNWNVAAYDQNGHPVPADILKTMSVSIKGERLVIRPKLSAQYKSVLKNGKNEAEVTYSVVAGQAEETTFRLNAEKGWIDLVRGDSDKKQVKGLYQLDGDSLRIAFAADKKRPKKMPEEPKVGVVRLVLIRSGK